jgi:hypothetical protein
MKRPLLLGYLLAASFPIATLSPAWAETGPKEPATSKASTAKKAKPVARAKSSSKATKKIAKKSATKTVTAKAPAAKASVVPAAGAATVVASSSASALAGVPAVRTEANPPVTPTPAPAPAPAYSNPYLAYRQQATVSPAQAEAPRQYSFSIPANAWQGLGQALDNVQSLLPRLPEEGQAILPRIKTVYPTGEKPLVVLTFKCPTELIGITTPPIKLLREGITLAMEGVNRSDLLPFNMQQVCQ